MHKFRAAIMTGASAYRLIASKPNGPARRRSRGKDAVECAIDPDLVARAGEAGYSRQELAAALEALRDESAPQDNSLAHWITCPQGEQPLLPKQAPVRDQDQTEDEPSLAGEMVPRRESRTADTRREDRIAPATGMAILHFRGEDHDVRVVNMSARGLQIESDLKAHIAEEVTIGLDGAAPSSCFVRWIRGGRIGLGFREQDLAD